MDFPTISLDALLCGLVADHASFRSDRAEKGRLETGSQPACNLVRLRCRFFRRTGPTDPVLGSDPGTCVYHLPDHLPFTGGYNSAFCNPFAGENLPLGSNRHRVVDSGDLLPLFAGTGEQPSTWLCLAGLDHRYLFHVGASGLLYEVVR